MTNRFKLNWCIFIGLATGLYAGLYLISPLAEAGVIYVTFVALPIFFLAGAKREEYPNFAISNITGVLWGMGYIFLINWMIAQGVNDVLSTALVCVVITIICCAFHMIVTPNTVFNKLPAMFGGISAAFSTWGEHMIPLMITLVFGTTLALIMTEATKLLTPEGHWKFLKKS
ncbi:MAG: DUF1097 domain-containing protein [Defluviitaleaceae bacterium]|nr:DUF1097 domain-containing protein [Defluviitaleaceae bacterium]